MTTTGIVVAIVLGSLVVIGIALVMLNRSWGDFPRRAGMPLDERTSTVVSASQPGLSVIDTTEPVTGGGASVRADATDNRILITHPMVRRAAESALYQNSPHARYLMRDGDNVYFVFDRIADPQQRQQAVDLMQRFQAGQHVDIGAVMRLMALLERG